MPSEQRRLAPAVLEQLPAGIVGLSESGKTVYANRAAAELLGRSVEECLSLDAQRLFGPAAAGQIAAAAAAASAEQRLSLVLPGPCGRALAAGVSVVQPPRGAVPGVALLVVFRDLDERRFAAEVLRRSQSQAALGRIVAGLSHELRNPLAAIQGLSHVLMRECSPEDSRFEPARRIGELVTRMEKLIAACVEAGNPPPPHLATACAETLAAHALEAGARERGSAFASPTLEVEQQGLAVRADVEQVLKCVRALVENACDASPAGAAVTVRVRADARRDSGAGRALIEVCDRGAGIPAPLLSRVFEPFYTTKPDRLGLGLALAQALALRNGATLDVLSKPGETVFTLALPLDAGAAP